MRQRLIDDAVRPVAANPELRQRILDLRATHDQVIDEVSVDVLLDAHGVVDTDRARSVVDSWRAYLDEHRDEITALQVLYERPQPGRVSFDELRELADRIKRPPHNWTPDLIWSAYEAIEVDRVQPRRPAHRHRPRVARPLHTRRGRRARPVRRRRCASATPHGSRSRSRPAYASPIASAGGSTRSPKSIATSAGVSADDLDNAPFAERGGVDGAVRDLGNEAAGYLEQLNAELTA